MHVLRFCESMYAEDNEKGRNVPDDGDLESEKEVSDVTPSQDGGKSNSDMTWHAERES